MNYPCRSQATDVASSPTNRPTPCFQPPTNCRYNDTDIIDIIKHYQKPEQDAELKRISKNGQQLAAR